MQVRNPEYYFAIADEKSISKAAEKLYVSKPYLSQYISKLEKDAGVVLIDRSVSPFILTDAGKVLYEYLEKSQQIEKELDSSLHMLQNKASRELNVGTPSGRGSAVIPYIIKKFSEMNPDVDIILHELPSAKLLDLLRDGICDLALLHSNTLDDDLIYEKLIDERILLCAPKHHPLVTEGKLVSSDGKLNLSVLDGYSFVLPRRDQSLARHVSNIFSRHKIKCGSKIVTTSSTTVMKLVAQGYGFAFWPESNVRENASYLDRVVCFTVMEPPISFPLDVIYKKSINLFPAARDFIDLTMEYYSSLPKVVNT